MVKNNDCELDKCTLTNWVDKNLDQSLSKKYIKSGFKVIRIQRQWITRLGRLRSTQQHLQTSQVKIMRVLMIQLMGKNNGEKMELLHN